MSVPGLDPSRTLELPDGALVIRMPVMRPPAAHDPVHGLAQLLARNMPTDTPFAVVHALEPGHDNPVAFARLNRVSDASIAVVQRWVSCCRAWETGENAAPDPETDAPASFEAVWQSLSTDFDLPASEGPSSAAVTLVPDGGTPVQLAWRPHAGDVLLRAVVDVLPTEADDDSEWFRLLLETNLHGVATGGSVFAIDGAQDEVIVWHAAPMDGLTGERLAGLINHVSRMAARFGPAGVHSTLLRGARAHEGPALRWP